MLQKCLQKAPQTYSEGGLLENLIKSRTQSIMAATSTNASTAMRKKSIRPVTQLGHQVPTPTNIFWDSGFDVFSQLLHGPPKNQYLISQPDGRLGRGLSQTASALWQWDIFFPDKQQSATNSETSGDRTATWFSLHHGYFFILTIKTLLAGALIRDNLQQSGEAGFSVVDAITLHRTHDDWWWTAAEIKPGVSWSQVSLFNCCSINSLSHPSPRIHSIKSLVLKRLHWLWSVRKVAKKQRSRLKCLNFTSNDIS